MLRVYCVIQKCCYNSQNGKKFDIVIHKRKIKDFTSICSLHFLNDVLNSSFFFVFEFCFVFFVFFFSMVAFYVFFFLNAHEVDELSFAITVSTSNFTRFLLMVFLMVFVFAKLRW